MTYKPMVFDRDDRPHEIRRDALEGDGDGSTLTAPDDRTQK